MKFRMDSHSLDRRRYAVVDEMAIAVVQHEMSELVRDGEALSDGCLVAVHADEGVLAVT